MNCRCGCKMDWVDGFGWICPHCDRDYDVDPVPDAADMPADMPALYAQFHSPGWGEHQVNILVVDLRPHEVTVYLVDEWRARRSPPSRRLR
jgi:hypothetical protein